MTHKHPTLPYSALNPAMSATTIGFHFGKHTLTYLDNVDKLTAGSPLEGMPLPDIVRAAESGVLLNNAAQAWNHLFFFSALSPSPSKPTDGRFLDAVGNSFGSMAAMTAKMEENAMAVFGSGWTWLVADDNGHLLSFNTANAGTPLRMEGMRPLLCIDVWEHAYYLDYQNRRADYLHNLWSVVDWATVEHRFSTGVMAR